MHSSIAQKFENFLHSHIPQPKSFHPHYHDALIYIFQAGGKRFRPNLLLNLVSYYKSDLVENAFYVAAAIEMLHSYSLIHDDLPCMDNSTLRRGLETLHVKYDEVTAVLIGDALNTHAFYLLSVSPFSDSIKIRLIKSLSQNGGAEGMVLGQAIDCHFENKILSYEQLKFLHLNKTAKLIAASLQMGAIVCELDEDEIQKWFNLGIDLGILFQIQDDLLDVLCDQKELGKPSHNDENKNTYVSILGLDKAQEEKQKLLKKIKNDLLTFPKPLQENFETILKKQF